MTPKKGFQGFHLLKILDLNHNYYDQTQKWSEGSQKWTPLAKESINYEKNGYNYFDDIDVMEYFDEVVIMELEMPHTESKLTLNFNRGSLIQGIIIKNPKPVENIDISVIPVFSVERTHQNEFNDPMRMSTINQNQMGSDYYRMIIADLNRNKRKLIYETSTLSKGEPADLEIDSGEKIILFESFNQFLEIDISKVIISNLSAGKQEDIDRITVIDHTNSNLAFIENDIWCSYSLINSKSIPMNPCSKNQNIYTGKIEVPDHNIKLYCFRDKNGDKKNLQVDCMNVDGYNHRIGTYIHGIY